MKRRPLYGTLNTDRGSVPVRQPAIAQALSESADEIRHLRTRVNSLVATAQDQQATISARNSELAYLQNHWWVMVGRFLRIIRTPQHNPLFLSDEFVRKFNERASI